MFAEHPSSLRKSKWKDGKEDEETKEKVNEKLAGRRGRASRERGNGIARVT